MGKHKTFKDPEQIIDLNKEYIKDCSTKVIKIGQKILTEEVPYKENGEIVKTKSGEVMKWLKEQTLVDDYKEVAAILSVYGLCDFICNKGYAFTEKTYYEYRKDPKYCKSLRQIETSWINHNLVGSGTSEINPVIGKLWLTSKTDDLKDKQEVKHEGGQPVTIINDVTKK